MSAKKAHLLWWHKLEKILLIIAVLGAATIPLALQNRSVNRLFISLPSRFSQLNLFQPLSINKIIDDESCKTGYTWYDGKGCVKDSSTTTNTSTPPKKPSDDKPPRKPPKPPTSTTSTSTTTTTGASCEGGSKDVKVKDGQYAYSGGVDKNGDYLCWQCRNGTWVDSGTCKKLHETGANVVAPPPGTAENEEGGKRRQNCSVKEGSTYVTVGDGTVRADGKKCHDGKWVDPANYTLPDYVKTETSITEDIKTDETSAAPALISGGTDACSTSYTNSSGAMVYVTVPHGESALGGANIDGTAVKICKDGEFVPCNDANRADTPGVTDCTTPTVKAGYMTTGDPSKATCVMGGGYQLPAGRAVSGADGTQVCKNGSMVAIPVSVNNVGDFLMGTDSGSSAANLALMTDLCKSYGQTNCTGSGLTTFATGWLSQADPTYAAQVTHQQEVIKLFDIATGRADPATTATLAKDCQTKLGHPCTDAELSTFALSTLQTVDPTAYSQAQKSIAETAKIQEEINVVYTFYLNPDDPAAKKDIQALCQAEKKASCSDSTLLTFAQDQLQVYDPSGKLLQDANATKEDQTYFNVALNNGTTLEKSAIKQDCLRENTTAYRKDNDTPINDCDTSQGLSDYAASSLALTDPEISAQINDIQNANDLLYNQLNTCRHKFQDWDTDCAVDENGHIVKVDYDHLNNVTLDPTTHAPASLGTRKLSVFSAPEPCGGFGEVCCLDAENQDALFKDTNATSACATGTSCQGGDTNFTGAGFEYGRCEVDVNANRSYATTALIEDRIAKGADSESINKIITYNDHYNTLGRSYSNEAYVSQLNQTTSSLCDSSCGSGGICAYSDQTKKYSCQQLSGDSLNQAYGQAIANLPPSNTDPSSGGLNQDCYRPTWFHIGSGSCDNDYLACENGKCQISDTGQSLLTVNSISKTPETLALNLATVNSDVSNLATYISTTPSLAATGCNQSYSTYKQNGSCWICWDSGVSSIQAAPDPSYCDNPQMASTLPGKSCAESGGYCSNSDLSSSNGYALDSGAKDCPPGMSCHIKNTNYQSTLIDKVNDIETSWINEPCFEDEQSNLTYTGEKRSCYQDLQCVNNKCVTPISAAFLPQFQEGLIAHDLRTNPVINAIPLGNFLVDHIVAPITAAIDPRYYQASSIQADIAHGLVNNAMAVPEIKMELPENFILNTLETISGDAKVLYGVNTLDDINSGSSPNVGGSFIYKTLAGLSLFTGAWTERYVPMGFRSGADIPAGAPIDNAFYGYASTWANDDASFGEKLLATSNFGIEISFTVGDFLTLGTESLFTKGSALARSSAIKVAGKTATDTVGEKILLGVSKTLSAPKVWGGAIEKSIGRGLTQVFADTGISAGSRFLTSKLVTGVAQIGTGLGLSGISNTYAAKWVAQGVGTLASTIGIKNNDTIITKIVKDAGLTADNILAKNTPDLFNSALTAGFKGTPEEFAATLSQKVIQNSPTSLINPLKSSDSLQTPVLKDLQAGVALSDTAQANLILDLSATHGLPPDDLKSILHILDFAEKSGITLTDDTITPFVKTFTDLSSSFVSNGPFSRSAIETLAGNNNLSESLTRQLTLALETSRSPLIMPITRSLNPLEPSTFLKPQEVVTESNLIARLQESGLSTAQAANLSATILHNTSGGLPPASKLANITPPPKTTPSTTSLSDAFDQKEVKRVRLSSQDNLSRVERTWDSTARSRSSGEMYRLSSTNITDPIRLQQVESFNKLLDDFEGAVGYHLYPEQVDTLLSSDVISQLKKLDGTSLAGKTDAVTRILSVKEPRSLSLFKSATEAQDFVNTQVLSDSGRKFYSGQNAHVIYLDNQRGFVSVDLTSPHFDLKSAQALSPEETLRLLNASTTNPNSSRLVFVSDRPSATWTRLGGNTDPSASWFDRLRGRGNPTQNGQIMQQITQGKHGSFLVIPDEIGDDIMGNFAISGSGKALSQVTDPKLLGGLKTGRDAVSIFTDISEGGTHKKLIDARLTELKEGYNESSLFRTVGPNQVVPKDTLTHANSLAEIIDQSLRKTNSTNTQLGEELSSLAAKLQDPKTSETAIGELDGILSKASSNTNLARRENNLLTNLSFRKTNLQDDWVQLNRRVGTDFSQEGNDLVLRKARSTTGERLSSTSQLITFYGHGPDMLEAYRPYLLEGADLIDPSRLPKLSQIEISPHQSQMQVVDLYREMQNAGHTLRGFDATPDTAAHLLGVNVTSIATLPAPTKFVNNADRDFLAKSIATNRKLNYAHQASAIGFPSSNADMAADLQAIVKAAEKEGVPYKTVIVAQYAQKPNGEMIEEYLQYSVKDGKIDYAGRIKLDDGKAWNDSIQKILAGNDPNVKPNDLLIGYLGRERAVDLKVTANHGKIRWSNFVDGTGSSAPTSEQMEQLIRRNRLVADPNNLSRLSEADQAFAQEFDLYLRSTATDLTPNNVMTDYFQKNHYQHLSNMRLDDLTRNLARAPEQALDSLDNIGKSLGLSPQDTKKLAALRTQLNSKASQFNGLMNSSISREPLEGDRLYAEIYRRADASNRQILSYADQITRTLNLSDSNQKLLRQALHIDQPLPPLGDFLAELARPTKRLTPAASFGPADQLMAFAQSNSTHPSSLAQYRAATSQYLATTAPPAAAAPRALTPTTPSSIGSRLSQFFRNLSDSFSSLRLPSFNSGNLTANLPNLSRTTNNLAFAARQEQLFNPTTLTFPRGVDLATGKFNLGTYLTSFVLPTSSWHALNRTLSDLQSGTLTTDEAVAQIADLPLPTERVKLITNATYTTYPTPTTPAINTELPYESQISQFLTGYPIQDTQKLINKLLEDQTKILADTKLLAPELRRTNPQKYLDTIRSVAAQHNIPIKSFDEIPDQFKNDIPATNAFYDDAWGTNTVYVKNPSSLDPTELGKLAHETVHALDYRLHPELSIEVKEYRAYISEYNLNSLVTDSLEEAQKTLTFIFGDKSIAGSVRGYLNQNNITKMPWENTTRQSPNSPTPPQTPITPQAQPPSPPINPHAVASTPNTDRWLTYLQNQITQYAEPIPQDYPRLIDRLNRLQKAGIDLEDIDPTDPVANFFDSNKLEDAITSAETINAEKIKTIPLSPAPTATNPLTTLSNQALQAGMNLGDVMVTRFNQILEETAWGEVIIERNHAAIMTYLEQGRFLNPAVDVSQEELVEITDTSIDEEFANILSGKVHSKDLPTQLSNPSILSLKLLELQLHSASFDQEGSNIILQRDSSLLMLDQSQRHGIYREGQYSSGVELFIPGEQPLTRIHSHPVGTLEQNAIESRGQNIDPELLNRIGDLPSTTDLTFLLQKGSPEKDFSCNSIIVVGPNTTTLIARTPETPAFIEYDQNERHKLLEELEALGSPDGDIISQQASKIRDILNKYHLVAYSIPLNPDTPFSSWERINTPQVNPATVSFQTTTSPLHRNTYLSGNEFNTTNSKQSNLFLQTFSDFILSGGDYDYLSPTVPATILSIPPGTPSQTIITINGVTQPLSEFASVNTDDLYIGLKYGDVLTFGNLTIQFPANPPSNQEEFILSWTIQNNDPNDLSSQLSNISLLNNTEKKAALTQFKENLSTRYQQLQSLYQNINLIISQQPTISRNELLNLTLIKAKETNLSTFEINNFLYGINALYNDQIDVVSLLKTYPDPKLLWKYIFGFLPQGEIKVITSYGKLTLHSSNSEDFAKAYAKQFNILNPRLTDISESYGGFHARIGRYSVSVLNMETYNTVDVLKHESQHAQFSTLTPTLRTNQLSPIEQSRLKSIEAEIIQLAQSPFSETSSFDTLTTTFPFTPGNLQYFQKFLDFYQEDYTGIITTTNNQITVTLTLLKGKTWGPLFDYLSVEEGDANFNFLPEVTTRLENLIAEYIFLQRKSGEYQIANELLAQIAGETNPDWPTAFESMFYYLSRINGGYDFLYDKTMENVFPESSILSQLEQNVSSNPNIITKTPQTSLFALLLHQATIDSFRKYYYSRQSITIPSSSGPITKIINPTQYNLVNNGLNAYKTIRDLGYSQESTLLLLQSVRLAHWPNLARRLASLSPFPISETTPQDSTNPLPTLTTQLSDIGLKAGLVITSQVDQLVSPSITAPSIPTDLPETITLLPTGTISISQLHPHEFGYFPDAVAALTELLSQGTHIDPIEITLYNGKVYTFDGANRVMTALKQGKTDIEYIFTPFDQLPRNKQINIRSIEQTGYNVIDVAVPTKYNDSFPQHTIQYNFSKIRPADNTPTPLTNEIMASSPIFDNFMARLNSLDIREEHLEEIRASLSQKSNIEEFIHELDQLISYLESIDLGTYSIGVTIKNLSYSDSLTNVLPKLKRTWETIESLENIASNRKIQHFDYFLRFRVVGDNLSKLITFYNDTIELLKNQNVDSEYILMALDKTSNEIEQYQADLRDIDKYLGESSDLPNNIRLKTKFSATMTPKDQGAYFQSRKNSIFNKYLKYLNNDFGDHLLRKLTPNDQLILQEILSKTQEALISLGIDPALMPFPNQFIFADLTPQFLDRNRQKYVEKRIGGGETDAYGTTIEINLPTDMGLLDQQAQAIIIHEISHFITKKVIQFNPNPRKNTYDLIQSGFMKYVNNRELKGAGEEAMADLFAAYVMHNSGITFATPYELDNAFMLSMIETIRDRSSMSALEAFKRLFVAKTELDYSVFKDLVSIFGNDFVRTLNTTLEPTYNRDATDEQKAEIIRQLAKLGGFESRFMELYSAHQNGKIIDISDIIPEINVRIVNRDISIDTQTTPQTALDSFLGRTAGIIANPEDTNWLNNLIERLISVFRSPNSTFPFSSSALSQVSSTLSQDVVPLDDNSELIFYRTGSALSHYQPAIDISAALNQTPDPLNLLAKLYQSPSLEDALTLIKTTLREHGVEIVTNPLDEQYHNLVSPDSFNKNINDASSSLANFYADGTMRITDDNGTEYGFTPNDSIPRSYIFLHPEFSTLPLPLQLKTLAHETGHFLEEMVLPGKSETIDNISGTIHPSSEYLSSLYGAHAALVNINFGIDPQNSGLAGQLILNDKILGHPLNYLTVPPQPILPKLTSNFTQYQPLPISETTPQTALNTSLDRTIDAIDTSSGTDLPLIINSNKTIIVGEQHVKNSLDPKSELDFKNGLDQSQIIVVEFESIKGNPYSQASSEKRFMQTAQEHAINTNKELIILNNEISDRYKLWLDSKIDISRADFAFMFGIHILQNDLANNLPLEESRRKILELYTNYFLGDSGYANQLTNAVFDSIFASTEIDEAKEISTLVLNFVKLDALARENFYQSRIKQVRDANPDKNILAVVGKSHALPISNTLTDGSLTIINTQLQDEINSV
ncbi:TPA: hypothetical protein DD448_02120, partial [Candidatus Collierbacteria bacterium]|nr:hypothetical protein [Candidatus Collierbacteria bacterium]